MARFLHLSDIHFRPTVEGKLLDVDEAVRTDLLTDLERLVDSTPFDAVLVVGDIAATGSEDEYRRANEFLDTVTQLVGCARSSVVCVPGNHDIDRRAQGPLHDGLRRLLRSTKPQLIGGQLRRVLDDDRAAEELHRPLLAYNAFAERLGCSVTAEQPIWRPKEVALSDRILRIHGVNSALTCDGSESDDNVDTRLALGEDQLFPLTSDGDDIVSMLLCHHPLDWLRDAESVNPWLARPHVLLTGHVHDMGIVSRPDGLSVTIAAGAVTPARKEESWKPAYNVLDLRIEDQNLRVDVRVRCYGVGRTGFGADERFGDPHTLRIPLNRHPAPVPDQASAAVESAPTEALTSDDHRDTFALLTESPDRRERAARAIGLIASEDKLETLEQERFLVARARSAGKLREWVEAIDDV